MKSAEWQALGEAIVTRHADRFNKILDELPPERFGEAFLKVLEYFKPKLQRVESDISGEVTVKRITGMEVV